MNDDVEKVLPFDSFSEVYKMLGWAGYYRPLNNPTSGYKMVLHQIYRPLALVLVVIYNLQHLIFIAQNFNDHSRLMECLMIEVSQLNVLIKISSTYFQSTRIDKLNTFLKDDTTFRVSDKDGQFILKKNKEEMHRLHRLLMTSISIIAVLWPSSYFVKRYNDPEEVVPSYMPFATDTWAKFSLSVFIECSPILWVGHGHLSLDALVVTYYALAQTQMKIIKQQLENFAGREEDRCYLNSTVQSERYRDLIDENIGKRFVLIVKRYKTLLWYTNEVAAIFNVPILIQLITSTSLVCIVVYNMTLVTVTSFQFVFLLIVISILLAQVFVYCYYGNLLEFESRFVNTSLYKSDWLSLSPTFRRLMLIAMQQWSRPIQARVCYIIPLSLTTFVTIVKSSYRVYTVLATTKLSEV